MRFFLEQYSGRRGQSPCRCCYKPFRSRWWSPHVHLHALGGPDWDPQWAPQGTPCLRDNQQWRNVVFFRDIKVHNQAICCTTCCRAVGPKLFCLMYPRNRWTQVPHERHIVVMIHKCSSELILSWMWFNTSFNYIKVDIVKIFLFIQLNCYCLTFRLVWSSLHLYYMSGRFNHLSTTFTVANNLYTTVTVANKLLLAISTIYRPLLANDFNNLSITFS